MNTSVENSIKERFVSFYKAMNDWYLYCNSLDKDQYSVNFYDASASKLNISLILSLFNVVFGFFSNTSIIRCA